MLEVAADALPGLGIGPVPDAGRIGTGDATDSEQAIVGGHDVDDLADQLIGGLELRHSTPSSDR